MTSPDTLPGSSPETFAGGFGNHPEPRLQQVGMAGPKHGFRQVTRIRAAEGNRASPPVNVHHVTGYGPTDQPAHVCGSLSIPDFRSFWSIYSKQPDPHLPEREGVTVNHAGDADNYWLNIDPFISEADVARHRAAFNEDIARRYHEAVETGEINDPTSDFWSGVGAFVDQRRQEYDRIMSARLIRERDDDEQQQQRREQPEDNRPDLLRRWIDRIRAMGTAREWAGDFGDFAILLGFLIALFAFAALFS